MRPIGRTGGCSRRSGPRAFVGLCLTALLLAPSVSPSLSSPSVAHAADAPPGKPPAEEPEEVIHIVTPAMQKRIDDAIAAGAVWLRKLQQSDGSFGAVEVAHSPYYMIGLGSLVGLALLAAGDDKDTPGIKRLVEYLRKRDALEASGGTRTTYNTGVLLMFLTDLYRGKPAKSDPRYASKRKEGCGLPKDIAQWVQELASWLISVQLEDGWWRYPHTPPSDLSNTQYAMLGLRAARDCGAEVPLSRFVQVLERTLATQKQQGDKVLRIIPAEKSGEKSYVIDGGDRARGWSYQGKPDSERVTGAMTTAAIAVLAICRDALMKPSQFPGYTPEIDRKVGRSVQDGFAWLDKHWTVAFNPPRGVAAWHYYYLYGLERAAAYANRKHVGNHDWYFEGATLLLDQQKPDGRWSTGFMGAPEITPSDACDTAYAILFLKKASRPTEPIPVPVVTSGK